MTELRTDSQSPALPRIAWAALLVIAGAVTLLHLLTNNRYGFHRDELQFLSDASHLDWGFVAYPPFTPFVEHLSLAVFGLCLVGLRLASVLAQTVALIATGLMARELGGGRFAQATAALTVALAPLPLFEGTEFQYSSFDYLWWVLIALFTIRMLRSGDPRWWLAIGAAVGVGLETKYSIVFFIAGILAGVVFSSARRFLKTPWFWAGIALALAIFLPNFLWQLRHQFISYHFLQYIHARDVRIGRGDHFLLDQFRVCTNPFSAPVWIAGAVAFFRKPRFRMLGWMFLLPVLLFFLAHGRGYYVAGVYPMALAMGAAVSERRLAALPRWGRRTICSVFFTGLACFGAYVAAVIVPLAPSGPLRDFALRNNGDLREQIGWPELVKTVAAVRDSLPPDQQAGLAIAVGNYGEAGAIEMLGPQYHLPPPISTINSFWLRSYPAVPPTTVILLGNSRQRADELFTNCRLAAHNGNAEGIHNEESDDHPDIFVCGPLRKSWQQVWPHAQDFG